MDLVRDTLSGLRQDMQRVFDRLDDAVSSNLAVHADLDKRLTAIEAAHMIQAQPESIFTKYAWIGPLWKLAWPIVLIFGALWRTAPEPTRAQVRGIAANATGINLPEAQADPAAKPVVMLASTTWTAKQSAGGPR